MIHVRGDHPHFDPGDGRTECLPCGKWVFPVIHSCKGVPVTEAARLRRSGGKQAGRSRYQRALHLLVDATEEIRDWSPLPARAQRDAVGRALALIGEAADVLNEAVHMDTIDLDEEDR